ncbi:MAG: hypothetical protein A3J66_03580 [Candidatus Magasanikbacteria bacterium RIFCSPHIGHO2_02_FULL_47_14]|uniref:Uncharacterized protein n=1 Tax=Candidatus Magasanikbacteria bacterium RIFCSPHIGHO2_02_FULL_47_14 TaxID=1798680 RepID=A0A1F6M754_9BACT|nr:MAG: hypothetical protein A3J66_03580 [Candidatus Magasanikbacteria bacterium RIFCSPHIGHO2_02_FULL_47_14]
MPERAAMFPEAIRAKEAVETKVDQKLLRDILTIFLLFYSKKGLTQEHFFHIMRRRLEQEFHYGGAVTSREFLRAIEELERRGFLNKVVEGKEHIGNWYWRCFITPAGQAFAEKAAEEEQATPPEEESASAIEGQDLEKSGRESEEDNLIERAVKIFPPQQRNRARALIRVHQRGGTLFTQVGTTMLFEDLFRDLSKLFGAAQEEDLAVSSEDLDNENERFISVEVLERFLQTGDLHRDEPAYNKDGHQDLQIRKKTGSGGPTLDLIEKGMR